MRLHQARIATLLAPNGNNGVVISSDEAGKVRLWDTKQVLELCPLDEVAATMVASKPRGSQTSGGSSPTKAVPSLNISNADGGNEQLLSGGSITGVKGMDPEELTHPVTVKARDSLGVVLLESIVEGSMMTENGEMVSSEDVVESMLQRLADVQCALEAQIESAKQDATGASIHDKLNGAAELTDSVSAKLETVLVKQQGMEELHSEQVQLVEQLQEQHKLAAEHMQDKQQSTAPQQLPSAKAVENAVEQIMKQNNELEAQCTRAEKQTEELQQKLDRVLATVQETQNRQQEASMAKIEALESSIAALRDEMALHSAGDAELDKHGLVDQVESVQAASKKLEADIQTRLSEHRRLEQLIQEQDVQHQQWQFDATSQLQQAETKLGQHQQALDSIEAPLQGLDELKTLQEKHAVLIAQIEQTVTEVLDRAATERKAGEDLGLAVDLFQEERTQLETQFNSKINEASASVAEHAKMLESLASLPDDLRGVVNRQELNQIQSELSREIDLLETSNQKTDQLKRQLDRVQEESQAAANRAEEELQNLGSRCEETVRDSLSWRHVIEMRVNPLEEADHRFRPMLEEMLKK